MKSKILFSVFGVILGAVITFIILSDQPLTHSVFKDFQTYRTLDTEDSVTCTYPQMLSVYYKNNQVEHSLPSPETNPIVFTFSDFYEHDSTFASIKYIDATQSIEETMVIILFEDDEKIVMVENNGESYITTHTIFKKQGISIFSKQILFPILGGIPSGTMAMGTCR